MQHRHCSRLRVSGLMFADFRAWSENPGRGDANHPPPPLVHDPCAILDLEGVSNGRFSSLAPGCGPAVARFSVRAQSPDAQSHRPNGLTNLSAECRVPASELLSLAPLQRPARNRGEASAECACAARPTIGQRRRSCTSVRLEHELEKPSTGRGCNRAGTELIGRRHVPAIGTIMNMAGETEPDLIVWQVGSIVHSAQAEITAFAEALERNSRVFSLP